jgi:hypothetical protein
VPNASCTIIKLGLTDNANPGGPAATSGPEQLALTNHDKGEKLKTPCRGRAKCTAAGVWHET